MRKPHQHKVLRCALAAVLACGLSVPAGALAAFADEENTPTPPLASEIASDGGAFDAPVDDVAGEPATGGDSPAEADGPAPDQSAPAGAEGGASGGETSSSEGSPAEDAAVAAATVVMNAAATVFAADASAGTRAATAGGFSVEGGKAASSQTAGDGDYFFDGTTLHILTSTPLTVSTPAATAHNIEINAGVQADLTLAGVTINSTLAPINLVTNSKDTASGAKATHADQIRHKTMLYLTIAENTTNTLVCTNATTTGSPGIRCGWGSILVIDDAVTNVRAGGSKFDLGDIITPEGGMVPVDATLYDGKTQVKAGDPLVKMDAEHCVLNVTGGGHSAGIGSAANENAGTLVFNGGTITSQVLPWNSSRWALSNAAGIGGGSAGSGTVMIFNGGNITSTAGSCGAGIGSGLGYYTADHRGGTPKADAISIPTGEAASGGYSFDAKPNSVSWFCCKSTHMTCPQGVHYLGSATDTNYFTVAGDITVNGGFISANSGQHGNAFGQSCAHGPSSNHNHIVRVTGGTLLTNTYDINSTNPPRAALGASFGYTIVTGGSVMVQKKANGKPAFQGIGGTAYNTTGIATWADVEAYKAANGVDGLPDGDKVQMLTIDLSSRFATGENKTVPISKWKLEINNIAQEYGAPSYLSDGKLYLWVPEDATGKNVTVTMSYLDDAGVEHDIEPLYVEEVGGASGSTLKAYIDIDVDSLTPEQQAYFGGLTKAYNGEPFEPFTVSEAKPIEITEKDGTVTKLKNPDKIEVSYQAFDEKGGSPLPDSDVVTGKVMPADTGIFRVQLVSKEKAETAEFQNLYWGHRITGWAEITPVPAVLTIDGVEWGHLDEATGAWTPITSTEQAGGTAGNRLKLSFNVRSANTTALTCKAPTGSFQVKIDGADVGAPIPLTEAMETDSPHSSFEQKDISAPAANGGSETRHGTVVTYYLDPANRDGLLELLEQAGNGGEHKVNIEYIADKNYIQGVDKNPENAKEDDTFIVPVPPEGDVKSDDPVTIKPGEDPGPGQPDPDNPTGKAKVIRKTITASYRDFHQAASPDLADFFSMEVSSSSSAPEAWEVTNPAVVDLVRGEGGEPARDKDGKVQIRVNSCGTSVITMEQKANALYTGIKYILTVNVTPDPGIKPQIQIRLTQRNLTALGQAASAQVAALSLAAFPAAAQSAPAAPLAAARATSVADRASMPPRPGDVMEYTVTGLNLTPGSAWQGAELKDAIDARLDFDADSVELARNYQTRTDKSTDLGTRAFYEGFDWDGLDWDEVKQGDYAFSDSTLSKMIGTVYGGQSTSVRFNATVGEDEGLGDRPADGKLPEIENVPGGDGGYNKPEDGLDPGEEAEPARPLGPGDIVFVGDDDPVRADPDDPDSPLVPAKPEPTPVLPKDPAAADIRTTVKVDLKESFQEHDGDRFMVGDVLTVTVTSTNRGTDSKLANAVVRATLPVGMEPEPGTIVLVDARGNRHEVPDSAYDPATGVIAVNAGDLYFDESAELAFDVKVVSTSQTRDPDGPANPDDPDGTGNRPADPPIEGGTLGETPTDEWGREHPMVPDPDDPDGPPVPGTPDEPVEKPDPGTPYEPAKPWPEIEGELVATDPVGDPDMPPVLPSDPSLGDKGGAAADIKVAKTAENVDRGDKTTHVGDTVRYTVTLSNSREHSMWYGAVIRDELPKGVEFVAGTAKVTGADGVERGVPDSAYDGGSRVLAVTAGDLPGGKSATLVFDAKVTEAAVGADIGNVASAHGTLPSKAEPSEVAPGTTRPVPGEPFSPSEGWDRWLRDHPGVDNAGDPAYPAGASAKGGVLPADGKRKGLAQTGDNLAAWALGLAAVASGAAVLCAAVARRRFE